MVPNKKIVILPLFLLDSYHHITLWSSHVICGLTMVPVPSPSPQPLFHILQQIKLQGRLSLSLLLCFPKSISPLWPNIVSCVAAVREHYTGSFFGMIHLD